MKRYNILQIGYPTVEDWKNNNVDTIIFKERGYAEVKDTDNHDTVWDMCNWSCYTNTKPENLHSDLTHCNSDIVVWVDGTNQYCVAETVGWKMFTTLESAKAHMFADKAYRSWVLR